MNESKILYENGPYFVIRAANDKGYEIYKQGITHAVRYAFVGDGPGPRLGAIGAMAECDRRASLPARTA